MSDRLGTWFPLLLLVLLAGLSFWLDRAVQPPEPPRDGSARHDPDYIVENLTAYRMGLDGRTRYQLASARMVHYPDDDSTHLTAPVFARVEAKTPELRITARRAEVSANGDEVHFRDDVTVQRSPLGRTKPLTIKTSYLHVVPDEDRAKTDQPVTITDPDTQISAVGLELDNRNRTMRLLSSVKVRYARSR